MKKQFNSTTCYGYQVWYLDTEDRSAEIASEVINPADLYWHRAEGPAYIDKSGTQKWFINDKRHRLDGPAYINENGGREWWVNGIRYANNKSFQKAAKITDEEMTFLIMKYGDVK